MAARLKVFVTSDGLTDYVVATTSRPKALAAWGAHQDLFKTGIARETDDPALVKAAIAQPGHVLRRAADTRADLQKLKAAKPIKAPKPKGPSKAALKKVADLEARLADADAAHAQAIADLERRHDAAKRKLDAALSAAKRALR